jgi:hypothetical protein
MQGISKHIPSFSIPSSIHPAVAVSVIHKNPSKMGGAALHSPRKYEPRGNNGK